MYYQPGCYYASSYSSYSSYSSSYYGGGYGGYYGISGTDADKNAPAVTLNTSAKTGAAADLPVSLKGTAKEPAKAYTFKAYGEK